MENEREIERERERCGGGKEQCLAKAVRQRKSGPRKKETT